MVRTRSALGALALAALTALAANGADWPQFRGPDRTGVSPDAGLLAKWPEAGPKVTWEAEGLGIGYSSVTASGDKVFTMGDVGKECFLFGLDRKTGKKAWALKVGKSGGNYQGPRCTPATDGALVFGLCQFGDLVAASAKTGKEVWRKNFKDDFKGSSGGWNFAESPLVDGNRLIVTPGGSEATMVALDKSTGKVEWKGTVKGGDTAGYASVVIANFGGVKQYVTMMANGLVSFDAKDGKMLWRFGTNKERFGSNTANIPTPIIKGDYVFAAVGYGRGAALLKVTKEGTEFNVEEVYWNRQLTNKHGGVILIGDKLYGDRDDSGNPWCADFATGKVLWTRKGGEGRGSASITAADGKLFIRYSDGWVVLASATAEQYEELSAFKVPNGTRDTWAHPVVVDGKFFVREREVVYCYDVKAK